VARKDIQNLVDATPTLKELSKKHEEIKDTAKRKFDIAAAGDKKKESKETKPSDECATYSDEMLWFFVSETHYGWLLRTDLGDSVDVVTNTSSRTQSWLIEKNKLLPQEFDKTFLFNLAKINGKSMEEEYQFNTDNKKFSIEHGLPTDALLEDENGSRIIRHDYDTDIGAYIVIVIPRIKKSQQLHLKAKRFLHLNVH